MVMCPFLVTVCWMRSIFLFGFLTAFSIPLIAQSLQENIVLEDSVFLEQDSVLHFIEKETLVKDTLVPQQDSVPYYYRINGPYLKTYVHDLKHTVTAPFRWRGRDWLKVGIIGGSAGILMFTADKAAREMVLRNQKEAFKSFSKVMYPFGNRLPPVLLAGLYATSLVTKNRRLEHVTLSATKSLAISTVVYTSSKALIRRQRPTRTDDPLNFVAPFTKKGFTSFPSGHANTAFSVATAFAMHYKDVKWVPWVAYSLASLTALSRLYDDRHWVSDVLIGASVGHFITRGIYKLDEKRRNAGRPDLKTFN